MVQYHFTDSFGTTNFYPTGCVGTFLNKGITRVVTTTNFLNGPTVTLGLHPFTFATGTLIAINTTVGTIISVTTTGRFICLTIDKCGNVSFYTFLRYLLRCVVTLGTTAIIQGTSSVVLGHHRVGAFTTTLSSLNSENGQ